MIIPLKTRNDWRHDYLICPRAPLTLEELRDRMLERAKVTADSYAYQLVDDLHADIFLRSLDLKADYDAYFAHEYDSFGEYLRRCQCFPSAAVAAAERTADESIGSYHFLNTYAFLEESYGLEFLTRLLGDWPARAEPD